MGRNTTSTLLLAMRASRNAAVPTVIYYLREAASTSNAKASALVLIFALCHTTAGYNTVIEYPTFSSFQHSGDYISTLQQNNNTAKGDGHAMDVLNAATASLKEPDRVSPANMAFATGSIAALVTMLFILTGATTTSGAPKRCRGRFQIEGDWGEDEEEDEEQLSLQGLHSLKQALHTMEQKEVSRASWAPRALQGLKPPLRALNPNAQAFVPGEQTRPKPKTRSSTRVTFGQVHTREMLRQPGGGGNICTHGVPLGIGWSVIAEHSCSVDDAEQKRIAANKKNKDVYVVFGRVTAKSREKWLLEAGAKKSALRKSAEVAQSVTRKRDESNADLILN